MTIKVNEPIHAKLLHQYDWDLDEIELNLGDKYTNVEVINVTEDVVTSKAIRNDGVKCYIYSTAIDNIFDIIKETK